MSGDSRMEQKDRSGLTSLSLVDRSSLRVIMFACVVIMFSILLIGWLVYLFTKEEAVRKLKDKDLIYIAESMASKVDGKISRAKETSLVLADDPAAVRWVEGGETDAELGKDVLRKLSQLVSSSGYSNSFVVSNVTRQYWSEEGRVINVLSESNPDDSWFFHTVSEAKKVTVDLDYNEQRRNTFVFINALMGDPAQPLAVAGVGLSLEDLSASFKEYKYGDTSSLWLIDGKGTVYLSDKLEHYGKELAQYIPQEEVDRIFNAAAGGGAKVLEYENAEGELYDLISFPLQSDQDLQLVFQIARHETVSFLDKVKLNALLAMLISLVTIVVLFYYISRKMSNPYKHALEVNRRLELTVAERTSELAQKNQELTDSILYAKRIQETVLPRREVLDQSLKSHAVIWRPRDIVGGDFYWALRSGDHLWLAVGDCTGHGVPGALMSMMVVSMLNQMAERLPDMMPSDVLAELNQRIKRTLLQNDRSGRTDDGLDLGICRIGSGALSFSGAGMSLFTSCEANLEWYRGDHRSIGYRRTPADYEFGEETITLRSGMRFYLSTDGLVDQNGGEKNHSFGRRRFLSILESTAMLPLAEQKLRVELALEQYMNGEPQRDDITLVAFEPHADGQD